MDQKSNSAKKVWAKSDTEFLVNLYASYGVPLWNTYLPQNDHQKLMAMNTIVTVMKAKGLEESDVRKKINYLRLRYKHELSKTLENPQYKPQASWYKKMDSFMRPHVIFKMQNAKKSNTTQKKRGNEDANSTPVKRSTTSVETPSFDIDKAFDVFGKSIAAQLKVLPKDVAVETQFRIQAILTDQTLMLGEPNDSKQNNQ